MKRIPAHLFRHPSTGILHFRLTVPARLRPIIGKREIRKSLKTGRTSEAVPLALAAYLAALELFKRAEQNATMPTISASAALGVLEELKERAGSVNLQKIGFGPFTIEQATPEEERKTLEQALKLIQALLKERPELQELAHALLATASSAPASPPDSGPKYPPLSELIKAYLSHAEAIKSTTEKTREEQRTAFNLLLDAFGDIPTDQITDASAARFKLNVLLRIPKNKNIYKEFQGMPLDRVIALTQERGLPTLSISTINNKYLAFYAGLFKWGGKHGYCTKDNPFSGLTMPDKGKKNENRERYSHEEIGRILSPDSLQFDEKRPWRYWVPWLGAFTGARLNELCQLHLDDIRQEDGIWCIDINERTEDKHTKTDSSPRVIPIHSHILHLGFLEYVEKMKAKGATMLFDGLSKQRNGYGRAVSYWYNQVYKKQVGIQPSSPGKLKDFHSFRHTVADELSKLNADFYKIQFILGHKITDITHTVYIKDYSPASLSPVIELLTYGLFPKQFIQPIE